MPPATKSPVCIAVGGREIGGFKEQHGLLANNWRSVIAEEIPSPEDNHFSILDAFANPEAALCKAAIRMMGL